MHCLSGKITILHSNVRLFISRVAEHSARLRLVESKLDRPFRDLTRRRLDNEGLPTMRVEGHTLKSKHDRADSRHGGGVAVFALERLAHRVPGGRAQLGDYTLGPRASRDRMLVPPAPGDVDTIHSFKKEGLLHAANAMDVLLGDLSVSTIGSG